jgi:hypothetical protein
MAPKRTSQIILNKKTAVFVLLVLLQWHAILDQGTLRVAARMITALK